MFDPKTADPQLIARAAKYVTEGAHEAPLMSQAPIIPGRGPVMMPQAAPGPGGGGGGCYGGAACTPGDGGGVEVVMRLGGGGASGGGASGGGGAYAGRRRCRRCLRVGFAISSRLGWGLESQWGWWCSMLGGTYLFRGVNR